MTQPPEGGPRVEPGPEQRPPSPAPSVGHNPRLEVDGDGIGWITFDDADRRVNVLDEAVMRRLAGIVEELEALARAGQVRVVVAWSGKADSFIAGADLDAIRAVEDPAEGERAARLGQAVYMDLERLPVPTVAAIHGVCLGGGTELALACRFRVVSDHPRTRIGLPEIQLGILPAWGGTTRLPRLVGLRAALDMLLTGRPVSASKARRIGFASEILPHQAFRASVRAFALETPSLPSGASRPSRGLVGRLVEDSPPGRRIVLAAARRRVRERTGDRYPAPFRILDLLRRHLGGSVEESLAAEARAAGELITSAVSRNLLHVFGLREAARKRPPAASGAEPWTVGDVGVVGAGVMGGGIAQLLAFNDHRVRMKDIDRDAVASGLRHARGLFDRAVEKHKLRRPEADRKMELVSGSVEYHGFRTLDLVVEAVVERADVKRAVLAEVEAEVPEACILATNTSSLSVDDLARGLRRPDRFAGLHFFNPVHKMPLVEVVRGEATGDATVATLHALSVSLGKVPVVCRDGPGFLVNRILGPYLNEAGWLLADGATVAEVDRAAEDFGMPMGPLRLLDEVGIDIARHAGDTLHDAFGDRMAPSPPLVAVGDSGRLGRKGGRGFYVHEGGKAKGVDEAVYADLGDAVPTDGARGGRLDADEICQRLVMAMVNEAARVLDDGIVESAGDVDVGMIMGTGFPPFRGGLLRFADGLHPRVVVGRLEELAEAHGSRFEPAPLLRELATADRTFYDAFGG